MQVSNTQIIPSMQTADVGSLEQSAKVHPEEAATAFEAIFASMLLKEMRNTLSEGFFGSESSDIFGGLFDLHMGQAMTDGNGLGIKELVLSQWSSAANKSQD